MKIKEDSFVLRQIADEYIVVPIGSEADIQNCIIKLNETSAFLWGLLENEKTINELVDSLINEYEIDYDTAKRDVTLFCKNLTENKFCE